MRNIRLDENFDDADFVAACDAEQKCILCPLTENPDITSNRGVAVRFDDPDFESKFQDAVRRFCRPQAITHH